MNERATSKGIGPAAIAAGAVALAAVGAVGWFATRGGDGVPELTPGATTSEVAAAPLPPVDMPRDPGLTSQNVLSQRTAAAPPAAQARATVSVPRRTQVARTRPAAASADTSGVNASTSAAIPGSPQPYSTLNPSAAPTTVNPATPPAQAVPAEPMPSTPPTLTPEPSPTPAPQDATPPADTPPQ